LKKSLPASLILLCPLALAQVGTFSGPGILSRDQSGVGQRSGQDVDLKYFVNGTGVYDTGMTPYAVTSSGTLVQPGGLFGMEVGLGGYGKHAFRRGVLGLDYSGNFRHYTSASNFDGSNQQLNIDYLYQKSRRLVFDFAGSAGTQNFGTSLGALGGSVNSSPVNSSSLLFDNRTSYYQTSMETRYAVTGRTAFSMGGSFYSIHRRSRALVGVNGYTLQGAISHQISRSTFIGASYQHTHYDFPRAFGESDINSYTGNWSTAMGRNWTLAVTGGVFVADVQGVQSTALDPVIATLLGISSVNTIFYQRNTLPMGSIALTRQFRRANWTGRYGRTVSPGNGVFLTSQQESYGTSFSYTGFRRWSLSGEFGVNEMSSIGQGLLPLTQTGGGATISYNMGKGFNLNAAYTRRHQDLQATSFQRDSSRISLSIFFSPGTVPISFR